MLRIETDDDNQLTCMASSSAGDGRVPGQWQHFPQQRPHDAQQPLNHRRSRSQQLIRRRW